MIDHIALIPIDGCSVNPARSLGSAIVYGNFDNMWVFTVGPFVGAIFAAVGACRPFPYMHIGLDSTACLPACPTPTDLYSYPSLPIIHQTPPKTVYKLIFGPTEVFNEYLQKAKRPVSMGRKK